ncbi:hypothetical protein NHX12_008312 [Muraenolepis orangiensis]|uniref:Uncharacterized protein n=1 Tax=Muraenolepis orangiensis TaxID=630683 RepID=A0A9Q0DNL4_9TELE|nr:hypothetical protein NHX12_008312 [Muraenolepis orangiensis]
MLLSAIFMTFLFPSMRPEDYSGHKVAFEGLTGHIEFNSKGQRSNYALRIMANDGLKDGSVSCAPLDSWACPRPRRHQDSSAPRCLDYTSSPVLTP